MQESRATSLLIPSSWNRERTTTDAQVETMPMLQREVGCDPREPTHAATQTEVRVEERVSARGIVISPDVVQLLLEAIEDAGRPNKHFERLEQFLRADAAKLVPIRRTPLQSVEKLPVSGMRCGRNGRVAVLFGYTQHESWCSHSGRVLVQQRTRTTSVHLASCPTQVLFAPQQQVVVATEAGELLVTFEGDTLWQSDAVHTQAVTCLRWVSPHLLFSAALDGRLVLSTLKATSLEAVKSGSVAISNLPRTLRRSNTSSRKTGVVAVTGSRHDCFIAGETGAIWSLQPDNLSVQALGCDPEGIEQLLATENGFLSVTPEKRIKRLSRDGLNAEVLGSGLHTRSDIVLLGPLLLFVDSTGALIGFDLEADQVALHDDSQEYVAVDVNDEDEIVAVDTRMNLNLFQIAQ